MTSKAKRVTMVLRVVGISGDYNYRDRAAQFFGYNNILLRNCNFEEKSYFYKYFTIFQENMTLFHENGYIVC